jgi:hypothetical protein
MDDRRPGRREAPGTQDPAYRPTRPPLGHRLRQRGSAAMFDQNEVSVPSVGALLFGQDWAISARIEAP